MRERERECVCVCVCVCVCERELAYKFIDRKIQTIDINMSAVFVVCITNMRTVCIRLKKCPFARIVVPLQEIRKKDKDLPLSRFNRNVTMMIGYIQGRESMSRKKDCFWFTTLVLILISSIRFEIIKQISLRNKSPNHINDLLNRSFKIERRILSLSIYASPPTFNLRRPLKRNCL